jgi:hypothetical protein
LVDAFEQVFADRRQANEMGVFARNRVQQRHTIDGMVMEYERLLVAR